MKDQTLTHERGSILVEVKRIVHARCGLSLGVFAQVTVINVTHTKVNCIADRLTVVICDRTVFTSETWLQKHLHGGK